MSQYPSLPQAPSQPTYAISSPPPSQPPSYQQSLNYPPQQQQAPYGSQQQQVPYGSQQQQAPYGLQQQQVPYGSQQQPAQFGTQPGQYSTYPSAYPQQQIGYGGYPQYPTQGQVVISQQPGPTVVQPIVVTQAPIMAGGYSYGGMMVLSILAVFCCWPLGIAAVVWAAQSRRNMLYGNTMIAFQQALIARRLAVTAIVCGIVIIIIVIILTTAGF